jgi:twitching motility two-component system response regulator PilH
MSEQQARIVLLIEDDASTADMYALGLSSGGFLVWIVNSAEAGLKQLAQGDSPSLIVLDLELGGMIGLDMLAIVCESPITAEIPVIVLSNKTVDFPEALRRGATECLAKHRTTPGELVNHVQATLNRRAELEAADYEHALAQQQRTLAGRVLADAEPLGLLDKVANAQAELFAGRAHMHTERALAHQARAALHFREATQHDRDANGQGQQLLAAAERLYAARHGPA